MGLLKVCFICHPLCYNSYSLLKLNFLNNVRRFLDVFLINASPILLGKFLKELYHTVAYLENFNTIHDSRLWLRICSFLEGQTCDSTFDSNLFLHQCNFYSSFWCFHLDGDLFAHVGFVAVLASFITDLDVDVGSIDIAVILVGIASTITHQEIFALTTVEFEHSSIERTVVHLTPGTTIVLWFS